MSTLRKNYSAKKLHQDHLLHEAIADMFSSDSENVKKVNAALTRAKGVAGMYKMQNILSAVSSAEQQFQAAMATKKTDPASNPVISNILTFSDVIAEFFNQMDAWISQLPDLATALQSSDAPGNEGKTIKDLLGPKSTMVAAIIQKQFDKSGGGFLKSIGRLFKTGRMTSATEALKAFGLDAQKASDDILNINAQQYKTLLSAAKQVQAPQIAAPPAGAQNPESGSTQSSQSNQSQASQTSQPAQQGTPAQETGASTGNAQMAQKPSPADAQKRDAALQGVVKNRNAFNTQLMSQLSNDEVKADLQQIAKSLGITLA